MTKDEALKFTRYEFDRHEIKALKDGYQSMPHAHSMIDIWNVRTFTSEAFEYDFNANKGHITEIYDSAKSDYFSNLQARHFSVHLIESGVALPEYVKKLICTLLLSTVLPKRKKGRSHIPNAFTERRVMMTVFKLKEKGYTPVTRNDISKPLSACDVVSEVLGECGFEYTYDAVRKIWDKSLPYRK
jgi:hypothetical protein